MAFSAPSPSVILLVLPALLGGCEGVPPDPALPPPTGVPTLPWPGPGETRVVDRGGVFGENLSGVHFDGGPEGGVLWAVRNGPSTLYRLVPEGEFWVPDPDPGWADGRPLRYADGSGDPDAEGVTRVSAGPWAGVYVATERNNADRAMSRNAVLRFEVDNEVPLPPGDPLAASHAWELNAVLPPTGPNLGIEAITWIPAGFLVEAGFRDEVSGEPWVPGDEAREGGGVFAVGVEGSGSVFLLSLDHEAGSARVLGRVTTHLEGVMGLHFDVDTGELWGICDNVCGGRIAILAVGAEGGFELLRYHDRPAALPDLNNEGFTIAPLAWCAEGARPAWWTDDDETGGVAIRTGWVACDGAGGPE
jgi:hypothetical protein